MDEFTREQETNKLIVAFMAGWLTALGVIAVISFAIGAFQ